jgi:superfamily II helicase
MYEELYELLTDTMEPEEALEWIKKFSNMIESNPEEVIKELDDLVSEKCEKINYCPFCLIPLQAKSYPQQSEYFGRTVSEPIYIQTCPDCGHEKD